MPKLTDKPHSLFITHGGLSFLRCLSHVFNKTDDHWLVFYDVNHHTYKLSLCTVSIQDERGESIPVSSLSSFTSFDDLYDYISMYADRIHCVAVDSNLGTIAGLKFSQLVQDIMIKTQCEEAFFFTEEPLCIEDTQEYLAFRHVLTPPISLKRAQVTQRGTLHQVGIHLESLAQKDTVHSESIHTRSVAQTDQVNQGCCSFFSKLFYRTGQRQSSHRLCFWSNTSVTPSPAQELVDGIEIAQGDSSSAR